MDLIEYDEDELLLKNQSKPECSGCMVGLDQVISQKEVKHTSNELLLERRRRRSQFKNSSWKSAVEKQH